LSGTIARSTSSAISLRIAASSGVGGADVIGESRILGTGDRRFGGRRLASGVEQQLDLPDRQASARELLRRRRPAETR
jgi:hypothetical protein